MRLQKANKIVILSVFVCCLMALTVNAVTVDVYQNMESGSAGDALTPEIMDASCHGGVAGVDGDWSFYPTTSTRFMVSSSCARQLPGAVTVNGVNYNTGASTRTWKYCDKYERDSAMLLYGSLPRSYSTAPPYSDRRTVACFLTPGQTYNVWNQHDILSTGANPGITTWCTLQIDTSINGKIHLRTHSATALASTFSPGIEVTPGKTYWINLHYDAIGGQCKCAAYDPDDNWKQVGNMDTCDSIAGRQASCRVRFGRCDAHGDNSAAPTYSHYSHIMVDYTEAKFPLLPDGVGSVDTSSPSAPGAVYDGTGADISSTTSTSQLAANWSVGVDTESGISGYRYAIGTSAGGVNAKGWTTIGNYTSTTTAVTLTIGTTYYFTVKSVNGYGLVSQTAANSNGAFVVAITSSPSVDTSSPTAPGIVRDGATASVDISSTMSTNTLSANWTQGSDPESAVNGYRYAIGTSPGSANTAGWTTLGNVLNVTRPGLTLNAGTTYYFTVKSINTVGLISVSATNSNGQYIVAIDTSDVTAPANIAVVRDGVSSDVDSSTSLTQLSANWDSSADAESGIAKYWYAIGTSQGSANTRSWTDNGQSISVTATGLALTEGVTYYISVKAENSVGLQSVAANSNGQYVVVLAIPDTTPPIISLVSAQGMTANTVNIIWTTDEASTNQVEYGKTTSYGTLTIENASFINAHSVTISNLTPGTQYYFRVISRDAGNNSSTSPDYTFTTLAPPVSIVQTIHAYPNPYSPSDSITMKFRIPGDATGGEVNIYSISGRLIKKLIDSSAAEIQWNGTNMHGEKVARGIYSYKTTSCSGDSVTGKIAVTR